MPSRISTELAQLARLARDGGLDLSQVSLRVKADLLMTTPHPPQMDLDAFSEMAVALLPEIDDATAVILARKLAGWRHAPTAVLQGLAARGGEVLAALIRHGMPLSAPDIETLASQGDDKAALALAERPDLTSAAILMLAEGRLRDVDLALIANTAITLPQTALDVMIERAGDDAAYGQGLLGRRDIGHVDLLPLFLQAGTDRRSAMLDSLAALDSLGPARRPITTTPETFTGWLATAGEDRDGAFGAIADHLGSGPALGVAMAADTSRDLAALALIASGVSVEDATRFLIRLGDEAAHSVARIFALVAMMRSVKPAVAHRAVLQIAGLPQPSTARKGQHQLAMDPSGTPVRGGAHKPENHAVLTEVMRKLGLRRG